MLFKKNTNVATGQKGEALALEYLLGLGCALVEKNYRKSCGEVDIIVRDRDTLVFVEVKSRNSRVFGTPFEAVDVRKQRQLSRIAHQYLHTHHLAESLARFDVIAVQLYPDNRPATIEHIKNAFDFNL